jgi:hypothetical protein
MFIKKLTQGKGALLAVAAFAAVAVGLAFPRSAAAAASVPAGGRLNPGQSITSGDGHYYTVMQTDGNVVTYVGGRVIWALNKFVSGSYLSMQGDGNLVLVNGQTGAPIWASGTNSAANGGSYLAMQNDGNLTVITPDGRAPWASGGIDTRLNGGEKLMPNQGFQSPDRRYRLVMQYDGNIVLVSSTGSVVWASGTNSSANAGGTLEMQTDGNMVLYRPGHIAAWSTGTFANGAYFAGQTDGNFVIYAQTGTALWSTRSGKLGGVDGSISQLAQKILDLSRQGKIIIQDYSENKTRDSADRSLASQQLADLAAGKQARLSTRCSYASQLPAAITPDPAILKFMVDMGQQTTYRISVLFGQCHSGAGSYHHKGKAVDLGCPVDTATGDRIGPTYGVKRNYETCAANGHFHYSVGGF